MTENSSDKNELILLEEYKSLKSEMQSCAEECVRLEIYAIGALGGFYSWYCLQTNKSILGVIPIALVIFGLWRSYLLLKRVEHMSSYLRWKVEPLLGFGYEGFFASDPKAPKLSCNTKVFWAILLVITCAIFLSNLRCSCCHIAH